MNRTKCKKSAPLTVDVFLNHGAADTHQQAALTNAFIKFLCYQKGQIPVPDTQLERRIKLVQYELQCDETKERDPVKPMKMKEKTSALKERRKKLMFESNALKFITSLRELNDRVSNTFKCGNQQVALILGTSIFNPQETFILDWSEYPTDWSSRHPGDASDRNLKQNQAAFFRYLVTAEELFPAMQRISPTKLHVMMYLTDSATTPPGCLPRVNFNFPPSRRHHVVFRMLSNRTTQNDPMHSVSRRLLFNSPGAPPKSKNWKEDSALEMSGIIKLDDDMDEVTSSPTPIEIEACWFQVCNSLHGFQDIL